MMKESNPDVTQSSILTDTPLINVNSKIVTSTQNTMPISLSVFDKSEPSVDLFNQIPRKRAKSLCHDSVGTHSVIPPLIARQK